MTGLLKTYVSFFHSSAPFVQAIIRSHLQQAIFNTSIMPTKIKKKKEGPEIEVPACSWPLSPQPPILVTSVLVSRRFMETN